MRIGLRKGRHRNRSCAGRGKWGIVELLSVRLRGEVAAGEADFERFALQGEELEAYLGGRPAFQSAGGIEVHGGHVVGVNAAHDVRRKIDPTEFLKRRLVRRRPDTLFGRSLAGICCGKAQAVRNKIRMPGWRRALDRKPGQASSQARVKVERQQQ